MIKEFIRSLEVHKSVDTLLSNIRELRNSIHSLESQFYDLKQSILRPPRKQYWVYIILIGQGGIDKNAPQTVIHSDGMWLESEQSSILYITPDVVFNENSILMVFGPGYITAVTAANQSCSHGVKIKFCPIPIKMTPANRLSCSIECCE